MQKEVGIYKDGSYLFTKESLFAKLALDQIVNMVPVFQYL